MSQFAGGQRQGWTTDWSCRSSGGTGPLHQLAEAFANPAQFVRGVDAAVRVAANGQARGGLQEDHGIMLPDVVKASWPLCSTKLRLLADRETLNTVWRAVVEALTSKIGPEFRAWCSSHFRYHDLEREIKIPVDSKHAGMFHTSDSVDLFGFVRGFDLALNWAAWRQHLVDIEKARLVAIDEARAREAAALRAKAEADRLAVEAAAAASRAELEATALALAESERAAAEAQAAQLALEKAERELVQAAVERALAARAERERLAAEAAAAEADAIERQEREARVALAAAETEAARLAIEAESQSESAVAESHGVGVPDVEAPSESTLPVATEAHSMGGPNTQSASDPTASTHDTAAADGGVNAAAAVAAAFDVTQPSLDSIASELRAVEERERVAAAALAKTEHEAAAAAAAIAVANK